MPVRTFDRCLSCMYIKCLLVFSRTSFCYSTTLLFSVDTAYNEKAALTIALAQLEVPRYDYIYVDGIAIGSLLESESIPFIPY